MRLLLLPVVFLLLSLPVLADVSVSADKPFYNFGDFIQTSYTVSANSDFSGLAKLALSCSNFNLGFHTLLTDLLAGQSQTVDVPALRVVSGMEGKCYVDADVSSFDGGIRYAGSSASFNVTGSLPVSVTFEKDVLKPSEELAVSGVVHKSHSSSASVELSFLGEVYASPVIDNLFAYNIRLPSDIKAGQHVMGFAVNDSYGNSGETSAIFTVEAVPALLSVDVGDGSAKPGDAFEVSVELFDQAGDAMNEAVEFSLLDSSGEVVLYSSNTTPASFGLKLKQSMPPGVYIARASSSALEKNSTLVVEPVESVSVSFDNRTLTFVNTGNVDYSRDLVISLNGTKKSFFLSKELGLKPGQATIIDLYKEAPEDDYEIALPELPDAPSFDAHLEDERSAVKKASDFVGITGRAVQETGMPGIQTILSPIILVVVIFLLIFFFSRNRGKPSSDSVSGYEAELAALRHYSEERHERQQEEATRPEVEKPASKEGQSVTDFMKNM